MLLFDMDGTLIDSNGVWKNVDREFLARRGIAYTHAYYEGVAHTILPLAAKFTKEYCRLTESCEEIIAEWMEMARDAYAHVTVKPGVRVYGVPATRLAEQLGKKMVLNIVMTGFFTAVTGLLAAESVRNAVLDSVPAHSKDLNLRAFEAGFAYGQKVLEGSVTDLATV